MLTKTKNKDEKSQEGGIINFRKNYRIQEYRLWKKQVRCDLQENNYSVLVIR